MSVEWVKQTHCPVCSSKARVHYHLEKGGLNPPVTFVRCTDCTVIYQNPMPSLAWLSKYYQSQYRERNNDGGVEQRNLTEEKMRGLKILRRIGEVKNEIFHHLDVGSSTGSLLGRVQERYGCVSVGVEPNHKFRDYSRGLFHGRLYESLYSIEKIEFDLITCIHTLEHIRDPIMFLEHINRRLGKGGLLLIEVPFENRSALRFPHMLDFNEFSLQQALNLAEFWRVRIETGSGVMHAYTRGG